jgi:hypothetical protein
MLSEADNVEQSIRCWSHDWIFQQIIFTSYYEALAE